MKKSLIMLILLVVAIAAGQKAEAQCPTGYLPGLWSPYVVDYGNGCTVEIDYCIEVLTLAEEQSGKVPGLHISSIEWIADPANACDMIDWATGGEDIAFAILPWEDIHSSILSSESAYDYAIANNIDPCSEPNRTSTIEVTDGGCYYLTVVIKELEVRRVFTPCDPTATVSCHQYWYVCKEWDPNSGWVVITERGPLVVPFSCSPVLDPSGNQRECFSVCN
jgi:hypothetical protein